MVDDPSNPPPEPVAPEGESSEDYGQLLRDLQSQLAALNEQVFNLQHRFPEGGAPRVSLDLVPPEIAYQISVLLDIKETIGRLDERVAQNGRMTDTLAQHLADLRTEIQQEIDVLKAGQTQTNERITAVQTALKAEILAVQTALKAEILTVQTVLKTEIVAVQTALKTEILDLRTNLTEEAAQLRVEMSKEFAAARTELHTETTAIRSAMLSKAQFWMGIGLIVTVILGLAAIFLTLPQ